MTRPPFPTTPQGGKPDGFCDAFRIERLGEEIEAALANGFAPEIVVRD